MKGLSDFGLNIDCEQVNQQLIDAVYKIYGREFSKKGFTWLVILLDELHAKAESITNGESKGYQMFGSIDLDAHKFRHDALMQEIYNILSQSWDYNLTLSNRSLTANN